MTFHIDDYVFYHVISKFLRKWYITPIVLWVVARVIIDYILKRRP